VPPLQSSCTNPLFRYSACTTATRCYPLHTQTRKESCGPYYNVGRDQGSLGAAQQHFALLDALPPDTHTLRQTGMVSETMSLFTTQCPHQQTAGVRPYVCSVNLCECHGGWGVIPSSILVVCYIATNALICISPRCAKQLSEEGPSSSAGSWGVFRG
jgi:hypothetical protein